MTCENSRAQGAYYLYPKTGKGDIRAVIRRRMSTVKGRSRSRASPNMGGVWAQRHQPAWPESVRRSGVLAPNVRILAISGGGTKTLDRCRLSAVVQWRFAMGHIKTDESASCYYICQPTDTYNLQGSRTGLRDGCHEPPHLLPPVLRRWAELYIGDVSQARHRRRQNSGPMYRNRNHRACISKPHQLINMAGKVLFMTCYECVSSMKVRGWDIFVDSFSR